MRTLKYLITAAMATALAFASCTKEIDISDSEQNDEQFSRETGAPVIFGASANYEKSQGTKADFSGYEHEGKERIDWEEGDLVSIICPQASNTKSKYIVNYPPINTDNTSTSQLTPNGTPLTWGTALVHNFYGLYCANWTSYENILEGGAGVEYTIEVNDDSYPLPRPCLTAFASANSGSPGQPVKLTFTPVLNSFEFELRNTLSNHSAIELSSISLVSYSDYLAGDLTIKINNKGKRTLESPQSGQNMVICYFDDNEILESNATINVRLYTLPEDIEKLSLIIEGTQVLDNTTKTWTLDLKKNGEWVTFRKLMKYNINNIKIPDHQNFFDEIEFISTTPDTVYFSPNGGKPLYGSPKVKSYTHNQENTITYPLPWGWNHTSSKIEFNKDKSIFNYPATQNNTETELVAEIKESSATDIDATYKLALSKLRSSAPQYKDLSITTITKRNPNPARYTANCYRIFSKGSYKFPLAYGNSIVNDQTNKAAYKYQRADSLDTPSLDNIAMGNHLLRFKNGAGELIKSPYFTAETVELVWEDRYELIESLKLETAHPLLDNSGALQYVSFTIGDNIDYGNALIAVKNPAGTILWTWHIWVNDGGYESHPHNPNPGIPATLWFENTPLGYIPPEYRSEENTFNIDLYPLESWRVKTKTIKGIQLAGKSNGRCLYYSRGRMTPLPGTKGMHFIDPPKKAKPDEPNNVEVSEKYYTCRFGPDGQRIPNTTKKVQFTIDYGQRNVDYLISHPTVIASFLEGGYTNLWNNNQALILYDNQDPGPNIKTVYDPNTVLGRIFVNNTPPSFGAFTPKPMGGIAITPESLKVVDFLEHAYVSTAIGGPMIEKYGNTGLSQDYPKLYPVYPECARKGWN